jgi:hypothetical protein
MADLPSLFLLRLMRSLGPFATTADWSPPQQATGLGTEQPLVSARLNISLSKISFPISEILEFLNSHGDFQATATDSYKGLLGVEREGLDPAQCPGFRSRDPAAENLKPRAVQA